MSCGSQITQRWVDVTHQSHRQTLYAFKLPTVTPPQKTTPYEADVVPIALRSSDVLLSRGRTLLDGLSST